MEEGVGASCCGVVGVINCRYMYCKRESEKIRCGEKVCSLFGLVNQTARLEKGAAQRLL